MANDITTESVCVRKYVSTSSWTHAQPRSNWCKWSLRFWSRRQTQTAVSNWTYCLKA